MDSCVIPLRHGGLSLVQTTDFFYPLVEDPYMMVSWFKHTCGQIHSHLVGGENKHGYHGDVSHSCSALIKNKCMFSWWGDVRGRRYNE